MNHSSRDESFMRDESSLLSVMGGGWFPSLFSDAAPQNQNLLSYAWSDIPKTNE